MNKMALEATILQQLRDIHLPPPITTWPMAPWGWLLLLILLIASFVAAYKIYQHFKRQQFAKKLLFQLDRIQNLYTSTPAAAIAELSVFLKRVCLTLFPRQEIISLQGDAWLAFLDKTGKMAEFQQGVGRCLLTAPYEANPELNFPQLYQLIQLWLKRVSSYV